MILVHGTFANMDDNWQAASPLLANNGYCVYAFNYGGASSASPIQGTGDIAASAAQLATFVNTVLAKTGAAKVDLVGHSQGGMMPRYYINFLGGAAKVSDFVALAPSNYGTTLDGLTKLASLLGVSGEINGPLSSACEACVEQEQGSAFLASLNAAPTVPGVRYTVIESADDEVVTPVPQRVPPGRAQRHQHHRAEPVRPGRQRPPGDRRRPGRAGGHAQRPRPGGPGEGPLPGRAAGHRPCRPGTEPLRVAQQQAAQQGERGDDEQGEQRAARAVGGWRSGRAAARSGRRR